VALAAAALDGYVAGRGRENSLADPVPERDRATDFACQRRATMSTSAIILLVVIVGAVLWAISVYNGLVSMRQRVNQAFADVDVQLRQRHDLVPNLVETVKGYAAHERGTLDEVVKARNAAVSAQGPAQQAAAENMLSGALRQLFALSEAYPDLKANTQFQQLQNELSDLENKIAASRRFFNNAVQEYNTGIQRFPAALFATSFGFTPKDFFDLGADRQAELQAPQVKF
jgi:LemA protein